MKEVVTESSQQRPFHKSVEGAPRLSLFLRSQQQKKASFIERKTQLKQMELFKFGENK